MTMGFVDTNEETQKLIMRWTGAGHEVIHDRIVFRHRMMRKDIDQNETVKYPDGLPVIAHGKTVRIGDVLPERQDVALDSDGRMFKTDEFVKRYREYIRWFQYVEGTDIDCEPVPDTLAYVLATPDRFSESPAYVEINYDARKPAPSERTHLYDNMKDEMVEIKQAQSVQLSAIEELLRQAKERRGPGRPPKSPESNEEVI